MVRVPTNREPIHPGEMLVEEFLKPMGITGRQLSNAIKVPYEEINKIISGKGDITPSIALRLAKYFGTSEDFWINLQLRWSLYKALKEEKEVIKGIEPFKMNSSEVVIA